MAIHSSIGFAGAVIGPLVFGIIIDNTGEGGNMLSWGLAFGAMGLSVAMGPLFLWLLTQEDSDAKSEVRY